MDRLEKNYYRVSEVAEMLGIPASTLRFWEKRFRHIKPRRSSSGHRLYTPADIDRIAMVHYLVKTQGLHLEAAEEQIRTNPKGVSRRSDALQRLIAIRGEVKSLLDAVTARRSPRSGADTHGQVDA